MFKRSYGTREYDILCVNKSCNSVSRKGNLKKVMTFITELILVALPENPVVQMEDTEDKMKSCSVEGTISFLGYFVSFCQGFFF